MNTQISQAKSETPENTLSLRKGMDWKVALMSGLAGPGVPRIFTAAQFHEFVQRYRAGATALTSREVSQQMTTAGALRRVSSGVFLNRRASPPAEVAEVASLIRSGAVISMHSVLGECGFLNNPSDVVTAVVPTSATKRPRLGEMSTSAGDRFQFFGVSEKFFPVSIQDRFELYQPGRFCDTFRPEAALLQWLHLSGMERSAMTAPPVDVDMSLLDSALLERLSRRWKLEGALEAWIAHAQKSNFGEEPEVVMLPVSAPSIEAVDRASGARARMMALRSK